MFVFVQMEELDCDTKMSIEDWWPNTVATRQQRKARKTAKHCSPHSGKNKSTDSTIPAPFNADSAVSTTHFVFQKFGQEMFHKDSTEATSQEEWYECFIVYFGR